MTFIKEILKKAGLENDFEKVDNRELLSKVQEESRLSYTYLALLISSTLVCSLGLLLGSAPVIIGGMIISPLMWPLMGSALGVSYAKNELISQSAYLLLISVILAIVFSVLITFISPIKVINPEIIARTNPTLLDIFVALAAGSIAALSLIQKRISDSVAGVAISTSLMPPLCVAGIGIALGSMQIATSGFLLFASNAISIIFISLIVFLVFNSKRDIKKSTTRKGLTTISIILIFTALPLIILLKNYSFKSNAYQQTQIILNESFREISPLISIQNIKTNYDPLGSSLSIDADVLIPQEIVISYQEKNKIISELENKLNKKINLNLRVQQTIALQSENDLINNTTKNDLSREFFEIVQENNSNLTINSLDIYPDNGGNWYIDSTLLADPSIQFTDAQRASTEAQLSNKINKKVSLNMDLISRIKLKSQSENQIDKMKIDISNYFKSNLNGTEIISININPTSVNENPLDKQVLGVKINTRIPSGTFLSPDQFIDLKNLLENKYKKIFNFNLNSVEENSFNL